MSLERYLFLCVYLQETVLPPSFMSSGRAVSKNVAKVMKIDSVMENAKLLKKSGKSILKIFLGVCVLLQNS